MDFFKGMRPHHVPRTGYRIAVDVAIPVEQPGWVQRLVVSESIRRAVDTVLRPGFAIRHGPFELNATIPRFDAQIADRLQWEWA